MNRNLFSGMALALVAVGCVSTPVPNAELETARTVVRTTEADPNVAQYAALDMQAARRELAIAESAAMHHDDANVTQPAYMAVQNARLAEFKAAAKADDARVAAGQAERQAIELSARNREAANADQSRDQAAAKAAALQAELDALKAKQ